MWNSNIQVFVFHFFTKQGNFNLNDSISKKSFSLAYSLINKTTV
jgi:hypothetical protein